MTRAPLLSTLLALLPLIVLAFPLAQVLHPVRVETPLQEEQPENPETTRTDLLLRSAHPFEQVTINGILIPAGEEEKELQLDPTIPLLVTVKWPEGTPESALLLEFIPDGKEMQTHTIWGIGEATEEITLTWEATE